MRAMRGVSQNVPLERLLFRSMLVLGLALAVVPATAQLHGPVPSATSIGGHYLPGPVPSVTSIRPYGTSGYMPYHSYPFTTSHYGRGRGYGYGYGRGGYGYIYPYYYIPMDDYGYGSDYVGPELYSGPPPGANDPTLHIVIEQPPAAQRYAEAEPAPEPPPVRAATQPDAAPLEPTLLIFRDGRKQEVTNYAIMGQTVYVFDKRTQKIALADLDVAATVKANDDRGIEFKVPAVKQPKKNSAAPAKDAPGNNPPKPDNIASLGQ